MLNFKAILCNALHYALNLGASYTAGLASIQDLLTPLVRMEHIYCIYCVLFVCNPSEHVVLVSKPFKDWKHATERFNGHFLNIKCDSISVSVENIIDTFAAKHPRRMRLELILDDK